MKNLYHFLSTIFIVAVAGCANTYQPDPASTFINTSYGNDRQATCMRLEDNLHELGYSNTDIVDMKDNKAANTIIAYKANGCEK